MERVQALILESVNCSKTDAKQIEDYISSTLLPHPLINYNRWTIYKAAKEAWKDLNYSKSADGKAHFNYLLSQKNNMPQPMRR